MQPTDTLDPSAVPYSPAGFRRIGISPVPSPASLSRWNRKGIRNIRPVTFLRGGRRYITPRAVAEFFAAVTRAADGIVGTTYVLSSANAQPTHLDRTPLVDVERELDREGL